MVVIEASPTLWIGRVQERIATPSRCTVQAPQKPAPQPNLAPFNSRESRSTHNSGVSPSTSTWRTRPFTLIL